MTCENDRAIVIGDAITGELNYLIPDPGDLRRMTDTGDLASGIAADHKGNIYAADVVKGTSTLSHSFTL